MRKNLYVDNQGNLFQMIEPVGSWHRKDCRHYAQWQPLVLKRFLGLMFTTKKRRDGKLLQTFWIEPFGVKIKE